MQFIVLCDYVTTNAPTDADISWRLDSGKRNLADGMINNFMAVLYLMLGSTECRAFKKVTNYMNWKIKLRQSKFES